MLPVATDRPPPRLNTANSPETVAPPPPRSAHTRPLQMKSLSSVRHRQRTGMAKWMAEQDSSCVCVRPGSPPPRAPRRSRPARVPWREQEARAREPRLSEAWRWREASGVWVAAGRADSPLHAELRRLAREDDEEVRAEAQAMRASERTRALETSEPGLLLALGSFPEGDEESQAQDEASVVSQREQAELEAEREVMIPAEANLSRSCS
jgi:hypothetical protein